MDEELTAFEHAITNLLELDDPLTVFERYYQHLLTRGGDAESLIRLLERATQTFVSDRRYRNDPRYLRLWLDYARRCREPEDIYAFLAMRGISSELASFYEEYAAYLESKGDSKAGAVLQAGVEREAQPLERLKKSLMAYMERNPKGRRRAEVRAFHVEQLRDGKTEREISFEEARAKSWRRAGSILKASYVPIAPLLPADSIIDELDEEGNQNNIDVDELTQISIYKDNTADLRELSRKLGEVKEKDPNNQNKENSRPIQEEISFDQFLAPTKIEKNIDPVSSDILDEFVLDDRRNARLSLIPEESDVATSVSGIIPSRLKELKEQLVTITMLNEQKDRLLKEFIAQLPKSNDPILTRLAAIRSSIDKDGHELSNKTVFWLATSAGNFFIEQALSDKVFLAVDLSVEGVSDDRSHQLVLKVNSSPWEAYLLQLSDILIEGKTWMHTDGILYAQKYHCEGPLSGIIQERRIHIQEKLALFWLRGIIASLINLHAKRIIHGRLSLDHIIWRTGTQKITNIAFDPTGGGGWSDHKIVLVGLSNAILWDESLWNGREDSLMLPCRPHDNTECLDNDIPPVLADLYALHKLCNVLLSSVQAPKHTLLWNSIIQIMITSRRNILRWDEVTAVYKEIISMIDPVLISESIVQPTLKSLLNQLQLLDHHQI